MSENGVDVGDQLAKAADLLRKHGYAVVYSSEHELWDRWLRESSSRTTALYDREWRLTQAFKGLLDAATRHCSPSRPSWLRHYRSWWHSVGYDKPIVRKSDNE